MDVGEMVRERSGCYMEAVEELQRQRDDLLAVARLIADVPKTDLGYGLFQLNRIACAIDAARAAIARAEGAGEVGK